MYGQHSLTFGRIGKQSEERAMTDRRRECERRQRCECGRLLVLDHASLPSKGEESTRWRPAAAWSQSHPPLQRYLLFKHESTRDGRPSIAVNELLLFCPGSRYNWPYLRNKIWKKDTPYYKAIMGCALLWSSRPRKGF